MCRKELLLIGTVHHDPEGLKQLIEVLRGKRPAHVAVEVSPYGLSYRKRHGKSLNTELTRRIRRLERQTGTILRNRKEIISIREKFRPPFEYRAAVRYCRESGASFNVIDLSSLSREIIEGGWDELITIENLRSLLEYSSERMFFSVAQEYIFAKRLLEEKDGALINALLPPWISQPAYTEREAYLEAALLDLYNKTETGCLVYVGGWQHLLHAGAFQALFQRLAHLNPRRLLLSKG
jgi:pheromone shutdown protein TraB